MFGGFCMNTFYREEDMNPYMNYVLEKARQIISIDSPTGFTAAMISFLKKEYEELGYHPVRDTKGNLLIEIGGEGNPLMLAAHGDTLGAMVHTIKANGRLKLTPLGGLHPENTETENCRIYSRFDGVYEGTLQITDASVHVNDDYSKTDRNWKNIEVVLDEDTSSAAETRALGISCGDIVCVEPRFRITDKGYIKSRFLDDKLSVAILMGQAKYYRDHGAKPERKLYHYITTYEEVGHGCAAGIPEDVCEVISVDMGCVGVGLTCTEKQVSICAKDGRGPYNYDVVTDLIRAAREEEVDYAVDIYPHYGSDADVALSSGHNVRHGLIGAGVYASHGYERSHRDGAWNTLKLILAYCQRP